MEDKTLISSDDMADIITRIKDINIAIMEIEDRVADIKMFLTEVLETIG